MDFSDLGTSAQSGGNHAAAASEELTIVDTVRYAKVEPGQTYRVVGTLMDKATGKPLEANGKPIVAEATFVAEAAEGTVEVAFTFDATSLGGTTTVAFEKLYDANGNLIAEHEDIEDEEQTVWIARIGTTAIDGKTKTHEGTAAKKTVIIDTVAFEGLEPGGRYSVTGTLYDKATGKPFEAADGTNPTATKTFTARSSSGSVDIRFSFDGSKLDDTALVAFERLAYENTPDVPLAVHEDIADEGQTVRYPPAPDEPTPPTPDKPISPIPPTEPTAPIPTQITTIGKNAASTIARTGDFLAAHWVPIVAGIALASATAAAIALAKRRKRN